MYDNKILYTGVASIGWPQTLLYDHFKIIISKNNFIQLRLTFQQHNYS